MISKETGLVLSHIHVREHERYKYDMLNYAIDNIRDHVAYIVLSGHGVPPTEEIINKVQAVYWEDNIDAKEIGVGHPKFCIKAFQDLHENGMKKSIILRYCDLIGNIDILQDLLRRHGDKIIISEQTSIEVGMIGDLFMAGETKHILDLWITKPWDYSKSGLFNLFDAACLRAREKNINVGEYIGENMFYVHPKDVMWVTLEGAWSVDDCKPSQNLDESCLWGNRQGYQYYGGF